MEVENRAYDDALLRKSLFNDIVRLRKEPVSNKIVSLEAQLDNFLISAPVREYYELVPFLPLQLESIRVPFTEHKDVLQLLAMLQKSSDTTTLLRQLQEVLLATLMRNVHEEEEGIDRKLVERIVKRAWALRQRKYMMERPRLTEQYILEDLLGLRITLDEKAYEKQWQEIIWEILSPEHYEDMLVILHLDETERELNSLYSAMNNVVNFKALIMLTMWRIAHSNTYGEVESLRMIMKRTTRCAEEDWILVYGQLGKDYPLFVKLHQEGHNLRPIHINIFYVDFDTSRHSQPTHIDLLQNADFLPIPFGAFFAQEGKALELSYMQHR